MMEKIAALLKEMGASDELVGQICEHLETYDKQIHDKYNAAYNDKLSKVKAVCVENVNKYKTKLAQKVSVFLESKSTEIEKRLEQDRAIEEAEASSKLRDVKNLVEEIEVADDAEIKALKEENSKLSADNTALRKAKKSAEVAANRANEMALSLVRENKAIAESRKEESKKTVEESTTPETKVTTEEKKAKKKTVKEGIVKKRLNGAKPKTTRKTLKESQAPASKETKGQLSVDGDIADIASQLDF
jgi:small-conductance mechanosensitive channel